LDRIDRIYRIEKSVLCLFHHVDPVNPVGRFL
jgi:hypothetical protein